MGWSYVEKRANLDREYLVKVLKATAAGLSVVEPTIERGRAPASVERLGQFRLVIRLGQGRAKIPSVGFQELGRPA